MYKGLFILYKYNLALSEDGTNIIRRWKLDCPISLAGFQAFTKRSYLYHHTNKSQIIFALYNSCVFSGHLIRHPSPTHLLCLQHLRQTPVDEPWRVAIFLITTVNSFAGTMNWYYIIWLWVGWYKDDTRWKLHCSISRAGLPASIICIIFVSSQFMDIF